MLNQKQTILKHLKKKPITALDAMVEHGIYRLASRIHELRNKGYVIKDKWEHNVPSLGVKPKKWKKYYLTSSLLK